MNADAEKRDFQEWLSQIGHNEEQALRAFWQDYFQKLSAYARRKLSNVPRRAFDEEDVALSAMYSFCRGLQAGHFEQLEDENELWRLLLAIASRKACAHQRHEHRVKRGGGTVRGESVFTTEGGGQAEEAPGLSSLFGHNNTPEAAALAAETTERLLDCLSDNSLREIAIMRLQGYGNAEIAEQLGCARRTVERKLEIIREAWQNEI